PRAGKGPDPQIRVLLARCAIRPALVASVATESRLKRDQIYPQGPRARGLSTSRRTIADRRLRYRTWNSDFGKGGDFSGILPAGSGCQGGARLEAWPFDRGAHRTRARL